MQRKDASVKFPKRPTSIFCFLKSPKQRCWQSQSFQIEGKSKYLTELVSRVLCAFARQSSIFTQGRPCVQAKGSATTKGASSSSVLPPKIKVLHRIGFTANLCYHRSGWALTSPFHPYRTGCGGLFLLHFPASRLGRTLSVILLCDARTFLTGIPFGLIPRGRPTELPVYYSTFFSGSQE